jgi:hypothetical protein
VGSTEAESLTTTRRMWRRAAHEGEVSTTSASYDMTPIKSVPLVCRCDSRDWRAIIFRQGDDTAAWQGAPGLSSAMVR